MNNQNVKLFSEAKKLFAQVQSFLAANPDYTVLMNRYGYPSEMKPQILMNELLVNYVNSVAACAGGEPYLLDKLYSAFLGEEYFFIPDYQTFDYSSDSIPKGMQFCVDLDLLIKNDPFISSFSDPVGNDMLFTKAFLAIAADMAKDTVEIIGKMKGCVIPGTAEKVTKQFAAMARLCEQELLTNFGRKEKILSV